MRDVETILLISLLSAVLGMARLNAAMVHIFLAIFFAALYYATWNKIAQGNVKIEFEIIVLIYIVSLVICSLSYWISFAFADKVNSRLKSILYVMLLLPSVYVFANVVSRLVL